jgi:hypothetical protein
MNKLEGCTLMRKLISILASLILSIASYLAEFNDYPKHKIN